MDNSTRFTPFQTVFIAMLAILILLVGANVGQTFRSQAGSVTTAAQVQAALNGVLKSPPSLANGNIVAPSAQTVTSKNFTYSGVIEDDQVLPGIWLAAVQYNYSDGAQDTCKILYRPGDLDITPLALSCTRTK